MHLIATSKKRVNVLQQQSQLSPDNKFGYLAGTDQSPKVVNSALKLKVQLPEISKQQQAYDGFTPQYTPF